MTDWPEGVPELPYFSPSRPRLGDRPQLLRPDGSPTNTILPSLIITPREAGTFELWGFFYMDGSASAPRFCYLNSWPELSEAYSSWLACPERFAVERMGWWPREAAPKTIEKADFKPSRVLSSSDLDDLL